MELDLPDPALCWTKNSRGADSTRGLHNPPHGSPLVVPRKHRKRQLLLCHIARPGIVLHLHIGLVVRVEHPFKQVFALPHLAPQEARRVIPIVRRRFRQRLVKRRNRVFTPDSRVAINALRSSTAKCTATCRQENSGQSLLRCLYCLRMVRILSCEAVLELDSRRHPGTIRDRPYRPRQDCNAPGAPQTSCTHPAPARIQCIGRRPKRHRHRRIPVPNGSAQHLDGPIATHLPPHLCANTDAASPPWTAYLIPFSLVRLPHKGGEIRLDDGPIDRHRRVWLIPSALHRACTMCASKSASVGPGITGSR